MHIPTRRHRLFIAAPLFALCVMISMLGGVMQSRGADLVGPDHRIIVAEDMQRSVEVAGGMLRLEPGTTVNIENDGIRVMEGRVLIVADDWLAVRVGDSLLTGWSGGWYVTVQGTAINIAALTTPVRLHQYGRTTIIPVRMQMTSVTDETFLPVPEHFLRDQLPLVLDRAHSSAQGRRSMPTDDRDPVLLSLHPERRNAAWILPLKENIPLNERLLRVMMLPVSDRLPAAIPAQVVRWWADDVTALLAMDTASGSLLREEIPVIAEHIVALRRDGYPARARLYASALSAVLADAPSAALPVPAMLQSVMVPDVSLSIVTSSAASSSAPAAGTQPSMDPAHVTAAVTDALHQAGFMFTTQTTIVPHGAIATVSHIALAAAAGDQLLHFSYDPVTNFVSSIEHGGKILPFALTLEKYVEWVKGEQ